MDMKRDSVPWTKQRNEPFCEIHHTTGQPQCKQAQIVAPKKTKTQEHSSKLASHNTPSIIPMLLVAFLLVASLLSPVLPTPIVSDSGHSPPANQSFHPGSELHKLRRVKAYLRKINKPAVKTIQACTYLSTFMVFSMHQLCLFLLSLRLSDLSFLVLLLQSPDGDVIDCVLSHLQPAFDHPELKGQTPLVISHFFFLISIKITETQTSKEQKFANGHLNIAYSLFFLDLFLII
jgi:hypothetical protein